MNDKIENNNTDSGIVLKQVEENNFASIGIVVSAVIIVGIWFYISKPAIPSNAGRINDSINALVIEKSAIEEKVLPSNGVILPVRWDDLGVKMVSVGVLDQRKIEALYAGRGGLGKYEQSLLKDVRNGRLKITEANAGFLLNLFWALGLGTKNDILEVGPMSNPRYGGAGYFASTGGWTLAAGDAMNHYSQHPFIVLTSEQQELVESVSKNIYRPCCNNPTHFPDCNHGMAMLGFLELMASQNVSEEDMYKAALQVNAYWFPDTYLTVAQYIATNGTDWDQVDSKEILGAAYSSGSGYRRIADMMIPLQQNNNSGCGIEQESTPSKRNSGGCGV